MNKLIFSLVLFISINSFATPVKYHCDLPSWWHTAPENTTCKNPVKSSRKKSSAAFQSFLKKYPKHMIEKHLKKVVFVRYFSLYGTTFAATYEYNVIYISTEYNGINQRQIEEKLHHEFSSILLNHYASKFPERVWRRNSGKYISESDHGRSHINDNDVERSSRRLLNQGFIFKYGSTDMENDVNTYSEYLFVTPTKIKRLAKRYKRVYNKHQLLKQFYCSIDKNFQFCGE